jgi:hypothetical protein
VTAPDGTQIDILAGSIPRWLNLLVNMSPTQTQKTRGLLGNYDGDASNDLLAADGSGLDDHDFTRLYRTYADGWRVTQSASLFDYAPGEDTNTYTNRSFPAHFISASDLGNHDQVDAESYCRRFYLTAQLLQDCILDVGLTKVFAFGDSDGQFAATLSMLSAPVPADAGQRNTGLCQTDKSGAEAIPGELFPRAAGFAMDSQCGVYTVRGNGLVAGPARSWQLRTPLADGTYPYTYGLAIDGNGSVFVADVGGCSETLERRIANDDLECRHDT